LLATAANVAGAAAAMHAHAAGVDYYPANAERGKQLASACLACHGMRDMPSGTDPAFRVPLLAGQRGEAIFNALLDYASGRRESAVMQPLTAALSVQDMRDLGAYLTASGPYVPGTVDQGSWAHDKVHRDCTACHGESGMGVMAGIPVLTGQYADYLVHALDAYRDGTRQDPTMGPIAKHLTPEESRDLAAYFAAQEHLAVPSAAMIAAPPQGGANPSRASRTSSATDVARSIEMVEIPAGIFTMGTDPEVNFQNGFPPHRVTVESFLIATTEVTFDQYDSFADATGRERPPGETWGRGDRPVIHVDWSDVHAFIDWLNAATGRAFRLPTEAEWEYAARGGTTSLYWWGNEIDHRLVNNSVDAGTDAWEFTAPVGRFPNNPFGLLDVLGNVWEFVEDCRHSSYENAPSDQHARLDGDCDSRVVRGGSWGSTSRGVQVAARGAASESYAAMDLGFRLAEDAPAIKRSPQ
jgi:formylglycine-generating enzyme required for sulfatase activity/cytochrome c2